ncbi:MAG: alpha/beta fold hydrolase [Bacteroidota bacterium]|jgi:predicted alpha/beta hydrolase|nr:alpha/beta fold hydrolase [Cytophagales bacterium]
MITKKITITARDGYPLAATWRQPSTDMKGVIQFHGGTGIPQQVYGNLAAFLSEQGYATITFDYRGIGESKPETLRGFQASLHDWSVDMTSVFDWVISTYPNAKKTIIGHSMGGQLIGLMENHAHVHQLFLIASSTGYWSDMSSPYKWLMPPLWFVFIPVTTAIYGFAHAKKIAQGENLPKGVALQWRKWCIDSRYFERDFRESNIPVYFDQIRVPLTSIQITDDPIANHITANKILAYYTNAQVQVRKVTPSDLNVEKIGHTGYFSRRFKDSLWQNLLSDIDRMPLL